MISTSPHFLLYSEAAPPDQQSEGSWRFVLQAADGGMRMEAADRERGLAGSQLELLAVIRGLEALDQPSRVTLVTSSRYVGGGLRYGLEQWRRSGWQWERFGVMSPINNQGLWRRLDHALSYHVVECRVRRTRDAAGDLSERFRVGRAEATASDAAERGSGEGQRQADWGRPESGGSPWCEAAWAAEWEEIEAAGTGPAPDGRQIDPHWPRRRSSLGAAAAAVTAAAASLGGLFYLGAS